VDTKISIVTTQLRVESIFFETERNYFNDKQMPLKEKKLAECPNSLLNNLIKLI